MGVDQYAGLIFLALPLLLLYIVFSRTRRQQRLLAAAQASIRPGLRVMTTSGVHATVVSADDDSTVVLEIAPGVPTRWARQAIAQVFDDDSTPSADPEAVVDLTAGPSSGSGASTADGDPSAEQPTGQHDDNDFRSDDDRDNRTLT